jgi:hypothetical protein
MICQTQTNMPGAEGWNPHMLQPQQPQQDSVNPLLLAVAALLLLLLLSGGSEDDDSD